MSTFDIRDDIAEIPRVQEVEAPFTFAIALAHEVKELRAAAEPDEALIAAKEKELEAKTYKAMLVSVPRGRRQEIYEESLDKFVAKPSFTGAVDEKTQFLRGNYARIAVVASSVLRLVNPAGETQDEQIFEAIETIFNEAPDQVFETIERRVQEVNTEEDEQDELRKSTDF